MRGHSEILAVPAAISVLIVGLLLFSLLVTWPPDGVTTTTTTTTTATTPTTTTTTTTTTTFTGPYYDLDDLTLPGRSVNDSAFKAIVNVTPSLVHFPSSYSLKTLRPYVIVVDFSDATLLTESEVERTARRFLDATRGSLSSSYYLERVPENPWGVLPRWDFWFTHGTDTIMVMINAVTGAIMGAATTGAPFFGQGLANTTAGAEQAALGILRHLNMTLLPETVYSYNNGSNMNMFLHRFYFSQVTGPARVRDRIGEISLELDSATGGLVWFCCEWMDVGLIDLTGLAAPQYGVPGSEDLVLMTLQDQDPNIYGPCEYRLCWMVYDDSTVWGAELVLDAFDSSLLETREYL